ncbi:MAG: agmatine deiminase family protein [Gammaproteobacteria bacterium]
MLPPEFAPQSGVILTWPHGHSDWRDTLADITPVYIELARAILAHERLLVICYDEIHRDTIHTTLAKAGLCDDDIMFACATSNDTWIRDYGPLVTLQNKVAELHDFTFDGWDSKHPAALDDGIARVLHAEGRFGTLPLVRHALVLEGGSIESDGCGTLLTTSRCLLKTGRNPGIGRAEMESVLRAALGAERVLWLDHGEIIGDDTDGHVDMLARFCSVDTLAYSHCDQADDPHYLPLQAMAAQLQAFTTAAGQDYRLVPLPLPAPCLDADNRRLPASYANFLIINDAILMPAYNDPADDVAAQALQDCFPSRAIIPIDCLPLIRQAGSLHCATLQLPAGVLTASDD